jgi:hypothetical protein
MFGDSNIEIAAQAIAAAVRTGDHERAFSLLGQFVGDDQKQVAARAVELGADQPTIEQMLVVFGSGETIVITAKPPSSSIIGLRWSLVFVGVAGLLLGAIVRARLVR